MEVAADKPTLTVMAQERFNIIFADKIAFGMFRTGAYNKCGRALKGPNENKLPLDSRKANSFRAFMESQIRHGLNQLKE